MVSFDFSGKIVLVTGATGALGRVVARQFHQAGATLALCARDEHALTQLFPDLALDPQHLLIGGIDLRQPDDCERLAQALNTRFGRLDALVNTVGGFKAGPPVHETPLEEWESMLDMNLRTAFLVSRAIAPVLIRSGGGAMVHVSGRAGLTGFGGGAGYCAAKAGVIRLTESLSAELKEYGINVNCVLPGTIDTPSNRAARPDADFSRWVAPEALGEVLMFLCSPAARAIHGAAIPVYGLG
ncbi:MAG: 3-oxoacyl-ACP reductase [Armatimonadetes bacterium JP3_11]|jgi:NAD(P)-dependent dehydrogenase (short-subunit alcohol dehydrogenase family)|nr:MAG: 3-oxoacyl-ACP reductase [Armatimonadetes bacterium JP3_11]